MKRSKLTAALLILPFALVPALTSCGSDGAGGSSGSQKWSIGWNTADDSIRGVAAHKFKEVIEAETDGKVEVELFADETLGTDEEMIESVQVGALDFQVASSGALAQSMPVFSATDLPFIFEDSDEAHFVLDGEYGDTLKDAAAEEDLKMLNTFSIGFSQITTNGRPVESPKDLKGVNMRSPNEPVPLATFEQMGAKVSTIPFTDVYLALQQGEADGQFNPLTAIRDSKFYEVQENLSMVDIIFYHAPVIMNQDLWDGLDPDMQELVQKAADEGTEAAREAEKETEAAVFDEIESEFDKVVTPEKGSFQDAVQPVYDKFADKIGRDVVEQIQAELEERRANS